MYHVIKWVGKSGQQFEATVRHHIEGGERITQYSALYLWFDVTVDGRNVVHAGTMRTDNLNDIAKKNGCLAVIDGKIGITEQSVLNEINEALAVQRARPEIVDFLKRLAEYEARCAEKAVEIEAYYAHKKRVKNMMTLGGKSE